MRVRLLELIGVGAAVTALVFLTSFSVGGQTPAGGQAGSATTTSAPLKTPWGEPDLGVSGPMTSRFLSNDPRSMPAENS